MSYRVFLFDFDGTIADTMACAFEILNELSRDFGFRSLEETDLDRARDMTTRELMRHLRVPKTKLPALARRGAAALRSRIESIEPIPGVPEALRYLHEAGVILALVTSNSSDNVSCFLRRHQLEVFDYVRTSSRLMGKAHDIRQIMRSGRFDPKEMLFVGDETRDIEASRKAKIDAAAVLWGYNSRKALVAQGPRHVFERPDELLQLV